MVNNVSLIFLFAALARGPGRCEASSAVRGYATVPRLDARQEFDGKDFTFDLVEFEPEVEGDAGTFKVANLGNMPVLSGEGVSYAIVEIEACGLNLPHHHPRAAELGFIVKSENSTSVRPAFVEENNGRLIVNDIGEGQVAFVPAGLIHFVQNMGCSPATFLAAFSSEDPRLVTTTTQASCGQTVEESPEGIAQLPFGTIQASLALGGDEAKALIESLPIGVVEGEEDCLQRCGISY